MLARTSTMTVATCALTAVTLAGCGGSSGLSKADLITKANAICAAEETAGNAVPTPSNIEDATQAAAYFDKIDPIISGTTSKLEALKPNSDAKADWTAFLTARKTWSSQMHAIREKADAKDPSGLTDLQQLSSSDVQTAADTLGAKSCDLNSSSS